MSTTETKPKEPAIVRYDGQEFSIDRTVAESDSHLRAALAGVYPSLATAAFSRATENGRLVVTATKTAGTKGAPGDVAARLESTMLRAAKRGSHERSDILAALGRLRTAQPEASHEPVGLL